MSLQKLMPFAAVAQLLAQLGTSREKGDPYMKMKNL
jgi:hypothetical protein